MQEVDVVLEAERGPELGYFLAGTMPDVPPQVGVGRDDLPRIHDSMGIEELLHLPKRFDNSGAVELFQPLSPDHPVPMLAGSRAPVLDGQVHDLFRDGGHLLDAFEALEVDHRAHMETAASGVRIDGSGGPVTPYHLQEIGDVVRQAFRRDGSVLNKSGRLGVLWIAEKDWQAGLAHVPEGPLFPRVSGHDRLEGEPQFLDHKVPDGLETGLNLRFGLAVEFDDEYGLGVIRQNACRGSMLFTLSGQVQEHLVRDLQGTRLMFEDCRYRPERIDQVVEAEEHDPGSLR